VSNVSQFSGIQNARARSLEMEMDRTLVDSSNMRVCSAMKRTQKQVLWTSGGQFVCENAGLLSTGLLSSLSSATPGPITESMGGGVSTRGGEPGGGPWIWQLPRRDPEAENSGGRGAGALETSQIWFQLGCVRSARVLRGKE